MRIRAEEGWLTVYRVSGPPACHNHLEGSKREVRFHYDQRALHLQKKRGVL